MIMYEPLTDPITSDDQEGFIAAYKEAFGGKPYFEAYTQEEVLEILGPHFHDGAIVLARDGERVVGFGCALPLQSAPADVCEFVEQQLANESLPYDFDSDLAWYMSELGVVEEFRGRRIAYHLVERRLQAIAKSGGTYYVMRTASTDSNSRHLYEQIGAQQLAEEQNVSESEQVTINQSQSTARIYLYGKCKLALDLIT